MGLLIMGQLARLDGWLTMGRARSKAKTMQEDSGKGQDKAKNNALRRRTSDPVEERPKHRRCMEEWTRLREQPQAASQLLQSDYLRSLLLWTITTAASVSGVDSVSHFTRNNRDQSDTPG